MKTVSWALRKLTLGDIAVSCSICVSRSGVVVRCATNGQGSRSRFLAIQINDTSYRQARGCTTAVELVDLHARCRVVHLDLPRFPTLTGRSEPTAAFGGDI